MEQIEIWRNVCHLSTMFLMCFIEEKLGVPVSPKFVLKDPFHNKPALVQVMYWYLMGDKPLTSVDMIW